MLAAGAGVPAARRSSGTQARLNTTRASPQGSGPSVAPVLAPVLVAVMPVVAPVAGPLVRTVAVPVMAMAVAVVIGNDVAQHPAGSGAAQRDQGIAVRQQRARHAPQASADDGVARLVIGLRRGARAQCQ